MLVRCISVILLVCLLWGCSAPSPEKAGQEINIDKSALPCSENELFEMLFDLENRITLHLDMEETELAKMQADYEKYDRQGSKSPIYRKGDLHLTITTPEDKEYRFFIPEVGVRMKGNTSRTDFYNAEEGIYNIIHLKLDFQETFDDADYYGNEAKKWDENDRNKRKDRTFATLEKMDLRWNRCDDSTYLKEYFAYATYRENGIPAPHTNLASFDWAGVHMGIFTINEPVDSTFIKKNFPKEAAKGDLYKCGWAGSHNASFLNTNSIGIEDEDKGEFFAYDLKTNKKTSDHSALISMITALNRSDIRKEELAEWVDMDQFLTFSAVSYLLGNPDDMRNNYNNYYIYFRSDNGKAVFIPYDYDRCLGVTAHWNPTGTGVTDDDPFTTRLQSADRHNTGTEAQQSNPLILYTIAKGGYYLTEYAGELKRISESEWFTHQTFEKLYKTASAHYGVLSRPGKDFYNSKDLNMSFDLYRTSDFASNGNISMQEYLNAKLDTLRKYLAKLESYQPNQPQISPAWYIRADFTDWQMNENYVLNEADGLFTITIAKDHSFKLKIYNAKTGQWFGTESVDSACTVPFDSDSHTNIVLEPGTYQITIDPATYTITLFKE